MVAKTSKVPGTPLPILPSPPSILHARSATTRSTTENLQRASGNSQRTTASGLSLVELIVVIAILSVMAGAAVPIAHFEVKRSKERDLRGDLLQMRTAIDRYKDAAEKGAFPTKMDSFNYPPDLQTMVDGVDAGTKKLKFLRKIPIDPMTGQADWTTRSMQDDPESNGGGGGENVFDVHSKSTGTALNGTTYNTW